LFKRGQTSGGATTQTEEPGKAARPRRVLVVGGRGHNADACVGWDDPRANVKDFDSVIVIPPAEDPADEVQWKYREALLDLLVTGGSIYVIATPRRTWPNEMRPFLPPTNYDWCPVPIGVDDSSGQSIETVDESVAWLFERVRTWSSTVSLPPLEPQGGFRGDQDLAVLYQGDKLATNRAGEALALRTRFQVYKTEPNGYFGRKLTPGPIGESGWVYVLPAHAPWLAEEVAAQTLAKFLDRQAGAAVPPWLTDALLPPTPCEDRELQELAEAQRKIDDRRPILEEKRTALRRVGGLLYQTGPALEALVAEALSELGVALSEPMGNEEYLALHDGVLAAMEVKGNSKSASGDDYRAAMDHAIRLSTEGYAARAILVVCAWRNLPPNDRRDWFPDNVVSPARANGTVALVRSADLYEAVLAHRRGVDVQGFVDELFSTAGLVGSPLTGVAPPHSSPKENRASAVSLGDS
jgi:hypothetical protein